MESSTSTAGIYIHIPFCKQACTYCNFHFSTALKYKNEMIDAIILEIEHGHNYLDGQRIETIYFGGGTPSLLSASEINRIIDAIYRNYNIGQLTEVTLEANPDDLSKTYIKALSDTPINRLSIGVQSFATDQLKFMNRAHNASEAEASIKTAQDHGLTNISIDLIYGSPMSDDRTWLVDLDKLIEFNIPHFSSYALTVEEKTQLAHNIAMKKCQPIDEQKTAHQFEMLMDFAATNKYDHYEISNFARTGRYAKHNTNYWLGHHYQGIGPSAHSYNGKSRKWNVPNNALYMKNSVSDKALLSTEEILSRENTHNEYVMTSLRTMWGCNLTQIASKWGITAATRLRELIEPKLKQGLAIIDGDCIVLTKKGRLYADGIAAELFLV